MKKLYLAIVIIIFSGLVENSLAAMDNTDPFKNDPFFRNNTRSAFNTKKNQDDLTGTSMIDRPKNNGLFSDASFTKINIQQQTHEAFYNNTTTKMNSHAIRVEQMDRDMDRNVAIVSNFFNCVRCCICCGCSALYQK
jgi:hypothetical protein